MEEIVLKLTEQEVQIIVNGIAELKLKDSYNLFIKIQDQINEQRDIREESKEQN